MRLIPTLFAVAMCCCSIPVHAQQAVQVTIENLQPGDGFYLTPVWTGFHDGTFDYFDAGTFASSTLQGLAEEGDVSGLINDFMGNGQGGVVTGPNGFGSMGMQPPVIDPGEIASAIFNVDPTNQFLSFGTMVIPSNDGFFGNDDPMAIEIFDSNGQFSFVGPIEFTLAQLWDAGSEVNDGLGAAFSAGGGMSTTEMNLIALHSGLANLDGFGTAAGTTINFGSASSSPVLRITVSAVPEPGSFAFAGLVGCCGLLRRPKRSS